ncbi:MAG: sugar nucleotide-binding protein [Bacteroidia bacterium]|nr:sugar nucleotide-binding protein [Bacteroidia bacterium]
MKLLLTGSNGTIGQSLKEYLYKNDYEFICWDRKTIPVDNYHIMEEFIRDSRIDTLIHLAAVTSFDEKKRTDSWKVNYEWPSDLAWICGKFNIRFIYTSSAMVFSGKSGPYNINSLPDATSGYGYEKRMSEQKVMSQNPGSVILRLGWQISGEGRNTINHYLDKTMSEKGIIQASTNWFPSCSFIEDTVSFIVKSKKFLPGIYMIDSNLRWNFYEIISQMKLYFNKDWNIITVNDFIQDSRMSDPRISIPDLKKHLPGLP